MAQELRITRAMKINSSVLFPVFSGFSKKCCSKKLSKNGTYVRKSDRKSVLRWRCLSCGKSYSSAKYGNCYRQNKRHINGAFWRVYCRTMSLRATSLEIGIHRITAARKKAFLARIAEKEIAKDLEKTKRNPVGEVWMDDLISFEHTRCKPLSVSVAVSKDRRILGFEISTYRPESRRMAIISQKKYGYRQDTRTQGFNSLLENIKPIMLPNVIIHTDKNSAYPKAIQAHFPNCRHKKFKSKPASDVGQGEIKEKGYDPLFRINQIFGMIRANVNRLIRKTWCTTKKEACLREHLLMYQLFHNRILIHIKT
jgi:transposase-like protein